MDVTSYAELVLAPQSADQAHPAFSKMFVVTDYLPELGVIIATRRRRSSSDPEVWAAHIAVVEGTETGPIEIETDRAKFIGRGRSIEHAAMAETPAFWHDGHGTRSDFFNPPPRQRIPQAA